MRRLYWAAGALVLAAVAALAVAPRFVDWNQWRGEIEGRAGAWLGLPVAIGGNVSVDLLPTPRLTATQVTLGDPTQPAASMRWVRAALDLRELIKGSVVLERVAVVEPQAHINRLGRALSDAAGAPEDRTEAQPPAFLGRRADRPVIPFEIEDGVLRGAPIDGLEVRLDQVDGVLSLRPNAAGGAEELAFEGLFALAGRRLSGGFRLQPERTPAGARLRLAVELETDDSRNAAGEPEARLTFAGTTSPDAPQRLTGDARLTARGLTGLPWAPTDLTRAAALYAPGALTLEGRLIADRAQERLALEDAAASTPALRGTGGLALSLAGRPRLDMRLALASLDLAATADRAAPEGTGDLLRESADAADPSPSEAPLDRTAGAEADGLADPTRFPAALAARMEAAHRALMLRVAAAAGAARAFDGLAVTLDLSVETLRTAGGVVRQASLKASADAGELLIERAGALLPGGSDVSLFGFVATDPDDPRFEGEVALQSDDARRILEWAGMEDEAWVRDLPRDRLRSVRLSASAVLTRDGLRVGDLLADVDAAAFTGSASLSLDQGPAALSLDLKADTVNLDVYRAPTRLDPTGPGAPGAPVDAGAPLAGDARDAGADQSAGTGREAALFRSTSAWARAIEDAPLTLDLSVDRLGYRGRTYEGVRLTLGARSGERRATVEVADAAALRLRAGLRFPTDQGRVDWRLAVRAEGPALDQTAAALIADSDWIQRARGWRQATLHATIDGNAAGLGFRADLGLGPVGAPDDPAPRRLTLGGVLSPAQGGGLALQVSQGELATPEFVLEGLQMAAVLPLEEAGPDVSVDSLSASYAGGLMSASGPIRLAEGGVSLDLEARIESLALDRLIGRMGPLLALGGRAEASGRVTADALDPADPLTGLTVVGRLGGRALLRLQDQAGGAAAGVRQLDALQRRLARDFPTPGGALSGAVRFADGRLTVRDMRLEGREATGRGSLTLDLSEDRLSGDLTVLSQGEERPYLEVEASGPIARPDVRTGGAWISGN
ncbi:MAG: AsmA-like C-terminal region-containing protein [Marivibrio sp.]|uniref:AsmA family protein n=1 Tax=Marivibrio sp. TaxID=2039719 RepID=UPI0032EBD224